MFEEDFLFTIELGQQDTFPYEAYVYPKFLNEMMYHELKLTITSATSMILEFNYNSNGVTTLLSKQIGNPKFVDRKTLIEIESNHKGDHIVKVAGVLSLVAHSNKIPTGKFGYDKTNIQNGKGYVKKLNGWRRSIGDQTIIVKKESDTFKIVNESKVAKAASSGLVSYVARKISLDAAKSYHFQFESSSQADYEIFNSSVSPWVQLTKAQINGQADYNITGVTSVEFRVGRLSPGEVLVKNFQITDTTTRHSYLPTLASPVTSKNSTLTIPQKNNIERKAGSLALEFSLDSAQTEFELLKIGGYSIRFKNKSFSLTDGNTGVVTRKIELPSPVTSGKLTIIWSWENNVHQLFIKNHASNSFTSALNDSGNMKSGFGTIDFTGSPLFSGTYHRFILSSENLLYMTASNNLLSLMEKTSTFTLDFSSKKQFIQKPFIEGTLAPVDGSPILVSDTKGQMRRHYFFDSDTGVYTTYAKESLLYEGQDSLLLSYDRLDPNFKIIVETEDGELVSDSIYSEDNEVFLAINTELKTRLLGKYLNVTYQLERSYVVEFNEDSALDSYEILFSNYPSENITVTQEGNRFSNRKLAKEIELNPIVNPNHKGFVYIVQNKQEVQGFRINVSSDMIHADGFDSAEVLIEAIDEDGNEVLSPYIDVYVVDEKGNTGVDLGVVQVSMSYDTLKARNTSGRMYYRYIAPYIKESLGRKTTRIFIVAYDRKRKVGIQVPIVLRPTSSSIRPSNKLTQANIALGFEYLARYFERKNIPDKILSALDFDGNKQLTREDLDIFLKKQYDPSESARINKLLKEMEDF